MQRTGDSLKIQCYVSIRPMLFLASLIRFVYRLCIVVV